MTLLVKIPLSLVRATLSALKIPSASEAPPAPKMSTNNRQNVTWVEVRPLAAAAAHRTPTNILRVSVESPPSGSSSHISAEHGTTACGPPVTAKTPPLSSSSSPSSACPGRDVSA